MYIPCPTREHAGSKQLPTSPCYQNRLPYGRVLRGDTQKIQFWSDRGMVSCGTEYSIVLHLL